MRREQPIFKDFDLPTQHLGEGHYVPPKARDADEIDRRKQLPRGTLLAEQQQIGLKVASQILKQLEDPADVTFASRLLAASGINTAWYSFAQNAEHEVQRRRLKLPLLIAGQPQWRPDSGELLRDGIAHFDEAVDQAGKVLVGTEYRSPRTVGFKTNLGRVAGKASLTLACINLGDKVVGAPILDSDVQQLVRQQSLQTLRDSRALSHDIGSHPSLAQLANPLSDLSVFWQREAPNGALQAFHGALEEFVG